VHRNEGMKSGMACREGFQATLAVMFLLTIGCVTEEVYFSRPEGSTGQEVH
jgi:hypothetical protein